MHSNCDMQFDNSNVDLRENNVYLEFLKTLVDRINIYFIAVHISDSFQ